MALNDYICTHPRLREEIEKRTGVIHIVEEPDVHKFSMESEHPNESDIPSGLSIQQALVITISKTGGVSMPKVHVLATRLDLRLSGGGYSGGGHVGMESWQKLGDDPPTVQDDK